MSIAFTTPTNKLETCDQRGEVACPRSHSQEAIEARFEPLADSAADPLSHYSGSPCWREAGSLRSSGRHQLTWASVF